MVCLQFCRLASRPKGTATAADTEAAEWDTPLLPLAALCL